MKKILVFIVLLVSIPVVIINFFYSYKLEIKSGFIKNKIVKNEETIRILKENGTVEIKKLEDYLIGVVSSEVPISFEKEALKAQAVAARTYALKAKENNSSKEYDVTTTTSSQVYKTNDELKEIWKENYENNINKIKEVIKETNGEYVSYEGSPIYAFFFSTSNGYTENNKNVFGKELPYLVSVDSSFDMKENKNSIVTSNFDINKFCNLININKTDKINIENIKRSETGRILNITINGKSFNGRDLQKKLGLRSNDYNIKQNGNNIEIITKGFGHGVGMSQYGANALAKIKKNYKEILKYYYKGTEIKKL